MSENDGGEFITHEIGGIMKDGVIVLERRNTLPKGIRVYVLVDDRV